MHPYPPQPPHKMPKLEPKTARTRAKPKLKQSVASLMFTRQEVNCMHPNCPLGAAIRASFALKPPSGPKKWVWFQGTIKDCMLALEEHGDMQLRIYLNPCPS